MPRLLLALSVCAVALFPSCKPQTDLNQSCRLLKGNPDGGKEPVPVREYELLLPDGGHEGKDFIGVGSVDCEDLICVRDSTYVSDAGLNDAALGYCSKQCTNNVDNPCPSYDPALDDTDKGLVCRGLLLSPETLRAVQSEFPGLYQSDFCARKIAQ